ncbi:hypothetical protein GCM10009836_02580 [Pseudonocardia ailaonensis]|uniref:Periplasmic binding protein domain-containing protein n=1 Tax=Pseudonocardia ailaonensis TaxID=367279 RepID=A0ABN2MJT5_9PSEU
MRILHRRLAAGAALLIAAGMVAACGQPAPKPQDNKPSTSRFAETMSWTKVTGAKATPELAGDTYTLDLGNGKKATWKKGDKLRVAAFLQGNSNEYLTAFSGGIKQAADDAGAEVTFFDAAFDPNKQLQQMQNAATSGRYNAAIIWPIISDGTCKAITQDLPAAGMPVVVADAATCGREFAGTGNDLWAAGSVAQVALDIKGKGQAFFDAVGKDLTAPTKAVLINGPDAISTSKFISEAAASADKKYDNLEVVADIPTDLTDAGALTAVQNALQAHPDVTLVLLNYGGQIEGVAQALKRANLQDKVKVATQGGSPQEVRYVQSGLIVKDVPYFPATEGYCPMDMLANVWAGKPVPRLVLNQCRTTSGSPDVTSIDILTSANVGQYRPEY